MTEFRVVTARAGANIALVKYWGKRDLALNLPARGSLSLTLDGLITKTTVEFSKQSLTDELILNGEPVPSADVGRLSRWLDLVRQRAGTQTFAKVTTENSFPTASGLASSASGYAALALAATRAAGLEVSPSELSILARRGSGSAARSVFGGLVELVAGTAPDGSDTVARPIEGGEPFPLAMIVAIIGGGQSKAWSSTQAMEHCRKTSPMYQAWLDTVPEDLEAARRAIRERNLSALGEVTERSACAMHACALSARPAIRYFLPATVACMNEVVTMRGDGLAAYFTMDAGPHVKVLTTQTDAAAVAARLRDVAGVDRTLVCKPGPGAQVIS
jgi:diphosphomevalonate decarboxylase